ncbi:hypothetical protein BSU00_02910 [Tenacibaculum sp. SG-28]|nr:hypothetical protein BSU00_02910 [Tenacibaculum sp. SG-28]
MILSFFKKTYFDDKFTQIKGKNFRNNIEYVTFNLRLIIAEVNNLFFNKNRKFYSINKDKTSKEKILQYLLTKIKTNL